MAKKKKEVELKEVSRTEINGAIIIKYEDGSVKIIPAPIMLSAEEAEDLLVLNPMTRKKKRKNQTMMMMMIPKRKKKRKKKRKN